MTNVPDKISPNKSKRREKVAYLVVHWTGGTFASAVDWCLRDESDVSYHVIIAPDGEARQIVPWEYAAWAVGWSKSPYPDFPFMSGNHASESIALAGGPPVAPTQKQRERLVVILAERMVANGWDHDQVWRIIGHDQTAVFKPGHPQAGQFGRKPDPQGHGWLPLIPIREAVRTLLRGPTT